MDDFIATTMILSGISLDEPYLQYRLSILMKKEKKGLQSGKLPLTESYYLMGTVDPTGILKSNEVSIMLYVCFLVHYSLHKFAHVAGDWLTNGLA